MEKLLKAFLVSRSRPFPKAHDLGLLLDLCAESERTFEQLRAQAEPLTVYAVMFRYPGPGALVVAEVEAALGTVESVRELVLARVWIPGAGGAR